MIVIFINYYGTFLVVRLEKPINLMRTRKTCSMFQLFYTQSAFCTLIRVLYRGPRFIPSPQSVARSPFLFVDTLDWQKKILVRQKGFSTDKNISRPTKLISHLINIFIEPRRQKYFGSKNSRSLLSSMAFNQPGAVLPFFKGAPWSYKSTELHLKTT